VTFTKDDLQPPEYWRVMIEAALDDYDLSKPDRKFLHSILEWLDAHGGLTVAQRERLKGLAGASD
jgi:hypothetical protein